MFVFVGLRWMSSKKGNQEYFYPKISSLLVTSKALFSFSFDATVESERAKGKSFKENVYALDLYRCGYKGRKEEIKQNRNVVCSV